MKQRNNLIVYMYILLPLSLGAISTSGEAQAQSIAAQCKRKTSGSDIIGCSGDRPCILWLRPSGQKLQVGWDGQGDYDTYSLRWSRPGKAGFQVSLHGGQGGAYEIDNLHSCSTYSLKIQGCKDLAPGRVRCTAWSTALFTLDPELRSGPDTCQQQYVWRDAYPGDHVCVSPAMRDHAVTDNEQADSHRDPGDPDSCLPGFVWRGTTPDDHVCVAPQTRLQVQSDNKAKCKRLARCQ
jgi:hypothetical protein